MLPHLNSIGLPFIELPTVDSTNNYAMQLVHEGMALHGTAVFSHEQTKGKGQRGKQWLSSKNKNIALSIIIQPLNLSFSHLFLFNMAMALGAHKFFSKYAGEETFIKWPNDIYWRDRKAGGILIENIMHGSNWKYAIAGIGLNINQTTFETFMNKAVSLKQITSKEYDTVALAKQLCTDIDFCFQILLQEPHRISALYHQHLYKLNQTVKLKRKDQVFKAVIKGVDAGGKLVVQHDVEEAFQVGEVEWLFE